MQAGRRKERDRIDRLLAAARCGASASLLVRGDAGVGKTALLGYAAEQAGDFLVLEARGARSQVELAYGSLEHLLHPVTRHLHRIPDPQAAALRGALAHGPAVTNDRLAIALASFHLLAAADRPTLLLVDDLPWIDVPSRDVVLFVARRLRHEAIVVLLAARDREADSLDVTGIEELPLQGLDEATARSLLEERHPEIAPTVAARLVEVTGGNPLALQEIPAALNEQELAGRRPLPDPLPVGRGLDRALRRRLSSLPDATRGILLVAAANADSKLAPVLAAAHTLGLDPGALDPAEDAGIVELVGGCIVWGHPLLRSTSYHAATPPARRRAHRALASVSFDERRVWHLAAATAAPDEDVAVELEREGWTLRARSGHATAARAFERASELTRDPDARARRRLEAARDLQFAGRTDRARKLVTLVHRSEPDGRLRAEATQLLARVEAWNGQPADARDLLVTQAEAVRDITPDLAARLFTDAATVATMQGDYAAQVALAQRAIETHDGWTAAEVVLAHGMMVTGRSREARELLDAAGAGRTGHDALWSAPLLQLAGLTWTCLEEYTLARRVLRRTIRSLRDAGALGRLPFPLACMAELDFRTGRWSRAYAAASESVRLAQEGGHPSESAFSLVTLARIEAAQGRADGCRGHAEEAVTLAERYATDSVLPRAEAALGSLALATGQPERALVHLERVADLEAAMGIRESGHVLAAGDHVEALVRAGMTERAAARLEELEDDARATGRIWARAAVERCRGMLVADDGFEDAFASALSWHARTRTPFEQARTELQFGARLRRAKRTRDARVFLRSARTTFDRLGADPWTEQARRELAATGERRSTSTPAHLASLTGQEMEVASLVAEGAKNREIATTLFLSTKTIEFHLTKIYRKLGIRSRTELAALVLTNGVEVAAASGLAHDRRLVRP